MLDDQLQHIADLKEKNESEYDEYSHQIRAMERRIKQVESELRIANKEFEKILAERDNEIEYLSRRRDENDKEITSLTQNKALLETKLKKKDEALQFIEKELERMRDLFSQQDAKHNERVELLKQQVLYW